MTFCLRFSDAGSIDDRFHACVLCCRNRLYTGLRQAEVRASMTLETVVVIVISLLLMFYLIYALLRPEKF